MTYEEALKECREWFNSGGIGELDGVAFNMAINSLEKQIPKKPKQTIHNAYCPCCQEALGKKFAEIAISTKYNKFCPNCGQALDWGCE